MANELIRKIDTLEGLTSINVKPNENLRLELAFFDTPLSNSLTIHLERKASLNLYLADFNPFNSKFELNVELEEGASSEIRLAVLSLKEGKKTYLPNVIHLSPSSEALVSCYGIALDSSNLEFKGLSTIEKGAKKSITRQEAKIIIFDNEANGSASPALKINENDVKAGHGASIGRLNDEHLFYLESRGLSPKEAKRIITLGYLKPIIRYFGDEKLQERIGEAIERGISND